MSGTDAAIEALGDVIQAYRQRIAELERIVAQQQAVIASANGSTPDPAIPEVKESV